MNNLSEEVIAYINKPTTAAFLNAVKQFVNLLELGGTKEEFLRKLHLALSELYFTANLLQPADLGYADNSDFDRDELFEKKSAGPDLSLLVGNDIYWEVFDPIAENAPEPSMGFLLDDISDIYRDLRIELNKIERVGTNEAVEDAFWQLHFGLKSHWGHHCINAMRALHYMYV